MNIEELARRFAALASKQNLSKIEHGEAVKLMQQLKEAGMTKDEISKLSKGKWTSSTIKFYTPGIRATHPSPWEDTIVLLNDLISTGLTLDDVETAVSVHQNLNEKDITLDQVADLLHTADAASIELGTLIHIHENLRESGLSLKDIQETLGFRKELEKRDFGLDSLVHLVELIKEYGEPEHVIEAISEYDSLKDLQDQNKEAQIDLENSRQAIILLDQEMSQTCDKLSQMEEPLEAYEKAKSLGFTEEVLNRLSNLAQMYGGVGKTLKAVEAFTDYSDIFGKCTEAKTNLANLEAKTAQLETSYSHLKTAIDMCDTLIRQYKFGLDAIATIFSVAKKYGEPLELLKAIEAYGKLKSVQQELKRLEAKAGEQKKLITQLESRHQEVLDKLESLNATALQVGIEVSEVKNQLAGSKYMQRLMQLISNPESVDYNESGPIVHLLMASAQKWFATNKSRFRNTFFIESSFKTIIEALESK